LQSEFNSKLLANSIKKLIASADVLIPDRDVSVQASSPQNPIHIHILEPVPLPGMLAESSLVLHAEFGHDAAGGWIAGQMPSLDAVKTEDCTTETPSFAIEATAGKLRHGEEASGSSDSLCASAGYLLPISVSPAQRVVSLSLRLHVADIQVDRNPVHLLQSL
jgi:hypothetical protein